MKRDVEIASSRMSKICFCVLVACMIAESVLAQSDIPVGTWRMHISYRQSTDIAFGENNVYCSSRNGIFFLNKLDNSLNTITKLGGLSDTNISEIAYDVNHNLLMTGYYNGNIDIIEESRIVNYATIKNSEKNLKSIYHFLFVRDLSYISTGFGVVVFDLEQFETIEAYQNLSEIGDNLQIFHSEIFNDSLFLATEDGVIAGSLDPEINLQDFNNWHRYDLSLGIPDTEIVNLTIFNGSLYAAIREDGVYKYTKGQWSKEDYLEGELFNYISGSKEYLTVATDSAVWLIDSNLSLSKVRSNLIKQPNISFFDSSGNIWIADGQNSLITDFYGNFTTITPTGPFSDEFFKLFYEINNDLLIAVPGGYNNDRERFLFDLGFYTFREGMWSNFHTPDHDTGRDLVAISFNQSKSIYYLPSFGDGLTTWDGVQQVRTTDLSDPDYPFPVNALSATHSKFSESWMICYDFLPSIYRQEENMEWKSLSLNLSGEDHILQVNSDFANNIWFRVDPEKEGGILVYNGDNSRKLSDKSGEGGLPGSRVYDIEVDREGNTWIGTDRGVAYFPGGIDLFNGPINAIRPIYDGRFLLAEEKITSIKADAGNHKWIGTENGVWLFDEFGENLIGFFSASSDPLLSDEIVDIEINDRSGEVFFATSDGMSSFRGTATAATEIHSSNVKIFPNPVTKNFNGLVAIEGLANAAEIKITDVAGNLVWQVKANGGTATWNLSTFYGGRPGTGIYLIYSSTTDGKDTFAGKIAIID